MVTSYVKEVNGFHMVVGRKCFDNLFPQPDLERTMTPFKRLFGFTPLISIMVAKFTAFRTLPQLGVNIHNIGEIWT